ncbi:MAG: DUF362 domain-containing protein [bacterium]|nr:MAG: DUF362 domain-containing protein [bacterium]
MSEKITRRSFIKKSATIGVSSVLGSSMVPDITLSNEIIDLAVVKGQNYFENTKKAVALLGGMEKFVPENSTVAILPNPQSNNPGTFTKPEIVRSAIQMCKTAGSKQISCIGWLSARHWINTGMKKVIDEEGVNLDITDLRDESLFKPVPVPRGVALKQARIIKTFYNYDVFINMNITKEHSGNNFSGAMKNLMGINSPTSDRTFHRKNWTMIMDDIEHLDQCIADLNTIIRADLCIVDATEFVTTNGPNGPGKLLKPLKVIAGTDPVAIDSYCATLFGYNPKDIIAINKAYEHSLGEMALNKVKIKELDF